MQLCFLTCASHGHNHKHHRRVFINVWIWLCCCLAALYVSAQVHACYTVYDHQNDTERKCQSCATAYSTDHPWSFDTGDSSTHSQTYTLGLWYISTSVSSPSLLSFWIIFSIQYPLLVNAMLHSRLCLCEKHSFLLLKSLQRTAEMQKISLLWNFHRYV